MEDLLDLCQEFFILLTAFGSKVFNLMSTHVYQLFYDVGDWFGSLIVKPSGAIYFRGVGAILEAAFPDVTVFGLMFGALVVVNMVVIIWKFYKEVIL